MKTHNLVLCVLCVILGVAIGIVLTHVCSCRAFFVGGVGRIQWETLVASFVAGVGALIAAGVTVRKMQEQIQVTKDQAEERRNRKAEAALAALPMVMLQVQEYAKEHNNALKLLIRCFDENGIIIEDKYYNFCAQYPQPFPALTDKAIYNLKEAIEFSDEKVRDKIKVLIKECLEENIRINHLSYSTYTSRSSVDELIARAGCIYALSDNFLQFLDGNLVSLMDARGALVQMDFPRDGLDGAVEWWQKNIVERHNKA